MSNSLTAKAPNARIPYWSASRLKMLLRCPRQFRYCYLDGIPSLVTAPLAFGKTVHEVLRVAGETHMESGELPTIPELVREFAVAWKHQCEDSSEHGEKPIFFGPTHAGYDEYLLLGGQMLERFYGRYAHRPPPLAVELAFEIPFGERTLVGFIDRVEEENGGLVVVDYKTGKRKPTPREASEDLQLTVYALAVRETLGQDAVRVEFHSLRDGSAITSQRDETALACLLGEVRAFAENALAQGTFPPCPGYYCRFCDYRELCEAETLAKRGDFDGLRD